MTDKQILEKFREDFCISSKEGFYLINPEDPNGELLPSLPFEQFLLSSLEQVRKEEREDLKMEFLSKSISNNGLTTKEIEKIFASLSQPEEKKIEKTFWKVLSKSKGMTNIYETKFVMQSSSTQPEEKKIGKIVGVCNGIYHCGLENCFVDHDMTCSHCPKPEEKKCVGGYSSLKGLSTCGCYQCPIHCSPKSQTGGNKPNGAGGGHLGVKFSPQEKGESNMSFRSELRHIITSKLPLRAFTMPDLEEGIDQIIELVKKDIKKAKPREQDSVHYNQGIETYEDNLLEKLG